MVTKITQRKRLHLSRMRGGILEKIVMLKPGRSLTFKYIDKGGNAKVKTINCLYDKSFN